MSNKYWNGTEHAVLKPSDVSAKWINERYGSRGLAVTNKAFCLWYHARNTANSANAPLMTKTLEDCGTEGWGVGVDDLKEAFEHLSKNNGGWKDNTSTSFMYNGSVGDPYAGGNGINVPAGSMPPSCSSFLGAVDDILPKMQAAMKKYQVECDGLQSLKLSAESNESDWEKLNKKLGSIKNAASKVSRYAWLAPPVMTANVPMNGSGWRTINSIEDAADKLSNRASQSVKFLDTVGKINDGLTLYVQATQAFNGDRRMGVAFAGLSLALGYVPVLGGFYGEIVKRIPGLVNHWRSFISEYTASRLHPEIYLARKEQSREKWHCPTCGSH